jgi:hypothetical protein
MCIHTHTHILRIFKGYSSMARTLLGGIFREWHVHLQVIVVFLQGTSSCIISPLCHVTTHVAAYASQGDQRLLHHVSVCARVYACTWAGWQRPIRYKIDHGTLIHSSCRNAPVCLNALALQERVCLQHMCSNISSEAIQGSCTVRTKPEKAEAEQNFDNIRCHREDIPGVPCPIIQWRPCALVQETGRRWAAYHPSLVHHCRGEASVRQPPGPVDHIDKLCQLSACTAIIAAKIVRLFCFEVLTRQGRAGQGQDQPPSCTLEKARIHACCLAGAGTTW